MLLDLLLQEPIIALSEIKILEIEYLSIDSPKLRTGKIVILSFVAMKVQQAYLLVIICNEHGRRVRSTLGSPQHGSRNMAFKKNITKIVCFTKLKLQQIVRIIADMENDPFRSGRFQ
jgi:hypothetical protein